MCTNVCVLLNLCLCLCIHTQSASIHLSPESWLKGPGSVLISLTLPCDSQPHQAAQSLGARRPFISQSAPQLSSGLANRDHNPPFSLVSFPLIASPVLTPFSTYFSSSSFIAPPLHFHIFATFPKPLLFLSLVPLFSIVFVSGTVSHRNHVRCSLTVLNKSHFPLCLKGTEPMILLP